MDKHLGQKPDVRPVAIVNHETVFADGEESETSTNDELFNADATYVPKDEIQNDPFLTGMRHCPSMKGKKSAPVRNNPTEGVKAVMEGLKEKWEEDKLIYEQAQKEEQELREKLLEAIQEQQQTTKEAVDVLKIIAQKL
jgi:hypothetical protein